MVPSAHDISVFHFSTAHVPPAERVAVWHEVFGRSVSRRVLTPLSDTACHIDMTVRQVARSRGAGVCVQRMLIAGGMSAERTRDLLTDGNDDLVLHIHETGRRIVSQLGREAAIGPGGALLTSNADPSRIVLPEPARFVSIGVPRRLMSALAPGIENALVQPLPPDAGVLRLLMRYLDVLDDECALSTAELCHAVAMHICDLCALAIGAMRDAADTAHGRGLRAARLRAIKADIEQHLANPDLSPATLAQRQRVTPRYLHVLFEAEGTTLSKYVLSRRIAHVHRMLIDPRQRGLTIGAIAYRSGFNDLSTFNREFRRHFGVTPSEVRRALKT